LKQLRKRLTYANVMSTISVFLILGGASAFAATQLAKNSVGSKQLKKNAVTSPKIKNGAVTTNKISAAAQAALQGAKGAVGPVGPEGPRGPSNGRASSVEGNTEIGKSEAEKVVVDSLSLAPGKWMVIGQTGLTNISGATRSAWCSLNVGEAELGLARALDTAEPTQESGDATVLGAVDLPAGGNVELRCWANAGGVWVPFNSRPAMQAIQVATLEVD
jgi:hypothetical protein